MQITFGVSANTIGAVQTGVTDGNTIYSSGDAVRVTTSAGTHNRILATSRCSAPRSAGNPPVQPERRRTSWATATAVRLPSATYPPVGEIAGTTTAVNGDTSEFGISARENVGEMIFRDDFEGA